MISAPSPPPARAKAARSSSGVADIGGDADPLVAVQGLDRHRVADLLGRGQGVVEVGHHVALGHREAQPAQERLAVVLAGGEVGIELAVGREGGRDAAHLPPAVAVLHQALVAQIDGGDAARVGGAQERVGGGAADRASG